MPRYKGVPPPPTPTPNSDAKGSGMSMSQLMYVYSSVDLALGLNFTTMHSLVSSVEECLVCMCIKDYCSCNSCKVSAEENYQQRNQRQCRSSGGCKGSPDVENEKRSEVSQDDNSNKIL